MTESTTDAGQAARAAEQQATVLLLEGPDINEGGRLNPPDNGLAVGSRYIVSDVNAVIQWNTVNGRNVSADP